MKTPKARRRGRPPTIIDVAREAMVGVISVPRVPNNHPSVEHSTRAKVMKAIARIGYSPNDAARMLKGRRDREGVKQGVRHLIEHAHKKTACVGFESGSYTVREQIEGYMPAIRSAGLQPILSTTIHSLGAMQSLAQRWSAVKDR